MFYIEEGEDEEDLNHGDAETRSKDGDDFRDAKSGKTLTTDGTDGTDKDKEVWRLDPYPCPSVLSVVKVRMKACVVCLSRKGSP